MDIFLKTFLNKDKMMIQWNELYQNYSLFMLQKKNFISDQLKNDKRNLKKKIGIGGPHMFVFITEMRNI